MKAAHLYSTSDSINKLKTQIKYFPLIVCFNYILCMFFIFRMLLNSKKYIINFALSLYHKRSSVTFCLFLSFITREMVISAALLPDTPSDWEQRTEVSKGVKIINNVCVLQLVWE